MSSDKLAYKANQIGRFFAHRSHAQAVASIADRLRKFRDPRMREATVSQVASLTDNLDPIVREAIERLRPG